MKVVKSSEIKRSSIDLFDAIQTAIPIIEDVKKQGDRALKKFTLKFDKRTLTEIAVSRERIEDAKKMVSSQIKEALELAKKHITIYHTALMPKEWLMEIAPGIKTGQLVRPLSTVGCYVPGGKYPLVSSVMMTVIPAKVAGVEKVIVCTPNATPEILVACDIAGVDFVYEVGGVQAIAALAYGTESILKVDKIVGPGNRYVTAAKKLIYGDVGIDFLAGPSEVLIIADDTGHPSFIAADLLAQAEHDEDAIAILVTTSPSLVKKVLKEIEKQLPSLSTRAIAESALKKNGRIVLTETIEEAFEVSNQFAPEHLEIHLENLDLLKNVKNAGAVFLGKYSAEAFGDYAAGPNHVLPTGGVAAFQSGLSVLDFIKTPTIQQIDQTGVKNLSNAVMTLARVEGLEAHARAVEIRK